MSADFDLAVIGSGFAGSLLAMIARRLGRSVVLIERGRHPRFAIGESSTPLASLLIEELARRYDLPEVASLAKWGTWQKAHPEIACGLKRGFTFYHHAFGQSWRNFSDHRDQLLVAASPHDGIADTHWYRPEFDHFLVREAQKLGVEYLDQVELTRARFSASGGEVEGEWHGQPRSLRARLVVDASGPRGFLHRALGLPEQPFARLPATAGLFAHFAGVRRWEDLHASAESPPYPVDDAAMHHVFDGGWIWVLRFNNGITSAGVAATDRCARELQLKDGAPAWIRLLERLPSVREQFASATALVPFRHAARLSFRTSMAAGERWALLPSATGFVDPLLSTGFPLTLLGIERLAKVLETDWDSPPFVEQLQQYSRQTFGELDTTASLVAALYSNLDRFEVFTNLSLLYFAAAMYAEAMRRQGHPERVSSFLLQDDPRFAGRFRACVEQAHRRDGAADGELLGAAIRAAIEPINLAGLGDPRRRNWYPAVREGAEET